MWEIKLHEMEEKTGIQALVQDGMPHAHNGGSVVESMALELADTYALICDMKRLAQHKRNEIYRFILGIEDPLLRDIVNYRCADCLTWEEVAMRIGSGTSGESCRKLFERSIPLC